MLYTSKQHPWDETSLNRHRREGTVHRTASRLDSLEKRSNQPKALTSPSVEGAQCRHDQSSRQVARRPGLSSSSNRQSDRTLQAKVACTRETSTVPNLADRSPRSEEIFSSTSRRQRLDSLVAEGPELRGPSAPGLRDSLPVCTRKLKCSSGKTKRSSLFPHSLKA